MSWPGGGSKKRSEADRGTRKESKRKVLLGKLKWPMRGGR